MILSPFKGLVHTKYKKSILPVVLVLFSLALGRPATTQIQRESKEFHLRCLNNQKITFEKFKSNASFQNQCPDYSGYSSDPSIDISRAQFFIYRAVPGGVCWERGLHQSDDFAKTQCCWVCQMSFCPYFSTTGEISVRVPCTGVVTSV